MHSLIERCEQTDPLLGSRLRRLQAAGVSAERLSDLLHTRGLRLDLEVLNEQMEVHRKIPDSPFVSSSTSAFQSLDPPADLKLPNDDVP
uniref:Uncharacterized protein n=1 Tax=Chromera velia CCMP2878 TaxID=1169474 RepID=A0A0G4HIJ3_9ALVE|eukprot:Cvel_27807.t1-p1 / transcript=Cvel_27807.t1 / gene=Cvel_27807 / organism=Chromera_velia_CCMP2878 / gene_product=hypothetical protein / transcript_product=hypothetical protein / location=Cvel_scaffold3530:438-1557(+) / protein_length=88 / sequence_SO=supercontig / SO=protein_coding / is_pseudo=false